jgi:hypothetical protein
MVTLTPLLAVALAAAPLGAPAQPDAGGPAVHVLQVGAARIEVLLPIRELELDDGAVLEWIAASARAVTAYEGRFPVATAVVRIQSHGGNGVLWATARFARSPEIRVLMGQATRMEDLHRDWVMTHEMVHLGFPSLTEQNDWMEEGLATYLEPIARARVGAISAEEAWGRLVVFLPKGLPKDGDRGLDLTPTWGRRYWGGAGFWLLADVEVRRRTHGRRGLDDALRAIVAAGGTIGEAWEVDRVIATGDQATGVPVLRDLYRRMATSPDPIDLDELWRSLGVRCDGAHVALDDKAPLAAVRRAITGTAEGSTRASRP